MKASDRNAIEDYAVIGDLHTAALVGRDGSIDWLCLPHFDSGACFAALLHDETAGRWVVSPTEQESFGERRYLDDSLVLETTWQTSTGTIRLLDFMPPRGHAADVVRIVECTAGEVEVATALRLRFDYGRVKPWVRVDKHEAAAVAGPDAAWLSSSVPVEDEGDELVARFVLKSGESESFVLTYRPSHLERPKHVKPAKALKQTLDYWSEWISQSRYEGKWTEPVHRALITLKALTYEPTGGILASVTTSLPEELGGVRNWDYRYCWLRDATFTLQALIGTGFIDEARAWREWLVRAAAGDPAKLQIMYGLDGRQRLPEMELSWLSGFDGASPVRIGNAAADQLQLDVWGEVLDGLHLTREAGLEASHPAWEVQRGLLDWLEGNWQEDDNGLWEVRGPRRPFVHSRVMAWAGFDRAVRSVERQGLDGPVEQWKRTRDEIHQEVCEKGFDADRGTFTQFYGSRGLDAALLLLPKVGFLPWNDERVVGTVAAVQRELSEDGLIRRYDQAADGNVDGVAGSEGMFLACSFWLADALHALGRGDEAEALFERLLTLRNDVGLLSEEYDVKAGRQLGNMPQAFSMVGLVNTAQLLEGSASAATTVGQHRAAPN